MMNKRTRLLYSRLLSIFMVWVLLLIGWLLVTSMMDLLPPVTGEFK